VLYEECNRSNEALNQITKYKKWMSCTGCAGSSKL